MIPQERFQEFTAPAVTSQDRSKNCDDDTDLEDFVHKLQAHLDALQERRGCDPPNQAEWALFFTEHEPQFLRLVRARHCRAQDCEDGMQELWLTLVDGLKKFQFDPNRGAFEDWISVVAEHRLVDSERCRKSRSVFPFASVEDHDVPGREPDPADAFERKRVQESVREALDELRGRVSARAYEAYRLHWIEGWSVKDISERLGMTEEQIWSSHHRTKEKLRALLERRLHVRA